MSTSFAGTIPPPESALAHYRLLSPTASVYVSPLCLGGMNFGSAWRDFMGDCPPAASEAILDFYYAQGGNFIDTANNYQRGESERIVGEWMEKRQNREQIVLATKYSTSYRVGYGNKEILANTVGNGPKSLRGSLEMSLKSLRTSYIDILYIHWWDYTMSVPQLMQSLHTLVTTGKVLFLGASDAPAWAIAKCNQYARDHALTPFSIYQGRYSAEYRDLERDVLPLCADDGMAITPYGALGSGAFKTVAQRALESEIAASGSDAAPPSRRSASDATSRVAAALEAVATKRSPPVPLTSIALAYVLQKAPYVFPIVGGRKIEHLRENIAALSVRLSAEEVGEIEGAVQFDRGFPLSVFGGRPEELWILEMAGKFDFVPLPAPILPPT